MPNEKGEEGQLVEVFVSGTSGAAKVELNNDSDRSAEKDPKNSEGRKVDDS
tara:strand:+ start:14885 stop:15037 length:153 start_codon:yes stop_codon:yes gene_type:complete